MRMFIAIPLPTDVRRELSSAQQRLSVLCPNGRFVPADNFHITMHFIGESTDLAGAALACDEAVRGIRPFVLRLADYGSFARGQSRTGYIGLSGELAELYRLHETLVSALRSNGFPCGGAQKRLTPHITLARELTHEQASPEELRDLFSGSGAAFTANQLVLFESRNVAGRMVYMPLHKAMF